MSDTEGARRTGRAACGVGAGDASGQSLLEVLEYCSVTSQIVDEREPGEGTGDFIK